MAKEQAKVITSPQTREIIEQTDGVNVGSGHSKSVEPPIVNTEPQEAIVKELSKREVEEISRNVAEQVIEEHESGPLIVKAANINSESATEGQILTANGEGGASWEDASGGGGGDIDSDVTVEVSTDGGTTYASAITLAEWIANCEAGNVYSVGTFVRIANLMDKKTFRLVLIGTEHDTLACDEVTKAKTTWHFVDIPVRNVSIQCPYSLLDWGDNHIGRAYLNEYLDGTNSSDVYLKQTNRYGFPSAKGFIEALHNIFDGFPTLLKEKIKMVQKGCYIPRNTSHEIAASGASESDNGGVITMPQRLFLLAGKEIGNSFAENEGSVYNYYSDSSTVRNRLKRWWPNVATAVTWATRSPYSATPIKTQTWNVVDYNGDPSSNAQMSLTFSIIPAFCI